MENVREVKKHAPHAFSGFQLTHKLLNNLQQFNISPTAKLVLLYLASCYNAKKADMFPKQKTIALKLGISERSVVRAVSELVKAGLILIEYKYSNRYKFTALIAAENISDEKFFNSKNLSGNKDNISLKNDNLSDTCIEPEKEHIKEPTKVAFNSLDFEEFKILKDYAQKHGAKNVNAYVNVLRKNGNAETIIRNFRNVQKSSEYMQGLTKQFLDDYKISKQTAVDPPQVWKDLKQILIERSKK